MLKRGGGHTNLSIISTMFYKCLETYGNILEASYEMGGGGGKSSFTPTKRGWGVDKV